MHVWDTYVCTYIRTYIVHTLTWPICTTNKLCYLLCLGVVILIVHHQAHCIVTAPNSCTGRHNTCLQLSVVLGLPMRLTCNNRTLSCCHTEWVYITRKFTVTLNTFVEMVVRPHTYGIHVHRSIFLHFQRYFTYFVKPRHNTWGRATNGKYVHMYVTYYQNCIWGFLGNREYIVSIQL